MSPPEQPVTGCDDRSRRVLLVNPRGFCAGVDRAIDAVERTLERFGAPVYVRRPIVHNRAVLTRLEAMGAVFVREVEDVPEGSVLIMSAHGVAPAVIEAARARRLMVIDATCPLVAKVHADVIAHHRAGRLVLLIGHAGHPEIVGTMGQVSLGAVQLISSAEDIENLDLPADTRVAYAVQTTFAVREARDIVSAIEARFNDVAAPRSGNICYATTNRQAAIEAIAREVDHVLVVGDPLSSNANRLVDVALEAGCPEASLVSGERDLDWTAIDAARTIGLTAAASSPASCVEEICRALSARGFAIDEQDGFQETVRFKPIAIDDR